MRVYIGTYTQGDSQGIYTGTLDWATGRLDIAESAVAKLANPSFLVCDPDRLRLYAVSEVSEWEDQPGGAVHAFAVEPTTGGLTALNSRPSGGAHPCHLSLDPAGRFVLVSNYSGGTVALLPLDSDGSFLDPWHVVAHGDGAHAHAMQLAPSGRHVLAADLGLDSVLCYAVDPEQGRLVPKPEADGTAALGAGPRHLAFHPDGRHVFVINELNSTLTAWAYRDDTGALTELMTVSTLPDGFHGQNSAADLHVHPSGRFLYGSNRGHDSLAVFRFESGTGRLTSQGHVPAGGRTPRNFALAPGGRFLVCAHQDSDSLATFIVDPETGMPSPTGHVARVPSPVCVEFFL